MFYTRTKRGHQHSYHDTGDIHHELKKSGHEIKPFPQKWSGSRRTLKHEIDSIGK